MNMKKLMLKKKHVAEQNPGIVIKHANVQNSGIRKYANVQNPDIKKHANVQNPGKILNILITKSRHERQTGCLAPPPLPNSEVFCQVERGEEVT